MSRIYVYLGNNENFMQKVICTKKVKQISILTNVSKTDIPFAISVSQEQYEYLSKNKSTILAEWHMNGGKYCILDTIGNAGFGICMLPLKYFEQVKKACTGHKLIPVWEDSIKKESYGGIILTRRDSIRQLISIINYIEKCEYKIVDGVEIIRDNELFVEYLSKTNIQQIEMSYISGKKLMEENANQEKEAEITHIPSYSNRSYFEKYMKVDKKASEKNRRNKRLVLTEKLESVLKKGETYQIITEKWRIPAAQYIGTEMIGGLKLYVFNQHGVIRKFSNPSMTKGELFSLESQLIFSGLMAA